MDLIGKVEPLPEELDPKAIPLDVNGIGGDGSVKDREIVLGRNVHTSCFEVSEPEADDEVTGEREAYMASVLARYRKSLLERTKHHLGMRFVYLSHLNSNLLLNLFVDLKRRKLSECGLKNYGLLMPKDGNFLHAAASVLNNRFGIHLFRFVHLSGS